MVPPSLLIFCTRDLRISVVFKCNLFIVTVDRAALNIQLRSCLGLSRLFQCSCLVVTFPLRGWLMTERSSFLFPKAPKLVCCRCWRGDRRNVGAVLTILGIFSTVVVIVPSTHFRWKIYISRPIYFPFYLCVTWYSHGVR